ncbi:MAG: CBS domain-containing protein [Polyangiales bacterium]
MALEAKLRDRFVSAHPAEAARVLELLPASDLGEAILDLPADALSKLLRWLTPYSAATALALVPAPRAAPAFEETPRDAAAAILRAMDAGHRSAIVDSLEATAQKALKRLLRYAEGTAGALMDPAVLSIAENASVAEALERLRQSPQHALYYVYVVAEDQKLIGVVNLRELMAARPEQLLGMIAVHSVESVSARASRESIVVHPGWKRFHALPVVGADGRFVGAIRYESVRKLEETLLETRLDDGSRETAAALGELYGLGLKGLFEWATSALLGPSGTPRRKS